MVIAVRAVGAVATATTGTAAPGLPLGWQPNDLHLLPIESENEPVPAMTGWLNVGSGTINVATGTVTALTLRYRIAQTGDVAPTVPASGTGVGTHTISRIIGFSGVDTANPWITSLFGTETVSDTTVAFPDITIPGGLTNSMIVHVFTTGQDVATAQSSGAGTNANLTGLTNRMNNWTNAGGGGGFAMITGTMPGSGAIGSTTTTLTTANFKTLFTGALREAAADTPRIFMPAFQGC